MHNRRGQILNHENIGVRRGELRWARSWADGSRETPGVQLYAAAIRESVTAEAIARARVVVAGPDSIGLSNWPSSLDFPPDIFLVDPWCELSRIGGVLGSIAGLAKLFLDHRTQI